MVPSLWLENREREVDVLIHVHHNALPRDAKEMGKKLELLL